MLPSSGWPRSAPWVSLSVWLTAVLLAVTSPSSATAQVDVQHERLVTIAMGRVTFQQFCAPCHGADGKGGGPVSGLFVADPGDLTQLTRKHHGQFPVDYVEGGLRAAGYELIPAHRHEQMPAWGPVFMSIDGSVAFARARLAALVAFLESIQN